MHDMYLFTRFTYMYVDDIVNDVGVVIIHSKANELSEFYG